jgi:hypothetical protein
VVEVEYCKGVGNQKMKEELGDAVGFVRAAPMRGKSESEC